MWNLIRREVRSRIGRLSLAALAIALGVAFVTMSFVLTDTSRNRFEQLFAQLDANADLVVIQPGSLQSGGGLTGPQVPFQRSALDVIRTTPGVAAADGRLLGPAQILSPDGKPVRSRFGATIAMSWGKNRDLSPLTIQSGRQPTSGTEVSIDSRTVREYHFKLGSRIRVSVVKAASTSAPFQRDLKLVGISSFGSSESFGSSTIIGLEESFAAEFFGAPGSVSAVLVKVESNAKILDVQADLNDRVGGLLVLTTAEAQAQTNKQIGDITDRASQFLVLFASLGVISGVVMIANTFSMIIAQRSRSLALMRALGASRRQVMALLAGESAALAILGSLVGLAFGALAARGILSLLARFAFELPGDTIALQPRTFVAAVAVGMFGTAAGALLPTLRTARLAPVPALTDSMAATGTPKRLWRRWVAGGCVVAGLVLAFVPEVLTQVNARAETAVPVALVGALMFGIMAAVVAALVAPKFAAALGTRVGATGLILFSGVGMLLAFGMHWNLIRVVFTASLVLVLALGVRALFREPGRLASRNAGRHAIRTGRTAVSLMIGIAVLSLLAVLVASLKGTISNSILSGLRASVVVADPNGQFIPPETRTTLTESGIVGVVEVHRGQSALDGVPIQINGIEPSEIGRVFDLGLSAGSINDVGNGRVLLNRGRADAVGVHVGEVINLGSYGTGARQLVVAGIYDRTLVSPFGTVDLIAAPQDAATFGGAATSGVYVLGVPGAAGAETKAAVIRSLDAAGVTQPSVYTRAEYAEHSRSQYDFALLAVYGLVLIGALVALMSIANTMFLSVYERTRELGLLRGIGMTRRQIRSMIRAEGLIIAVLGGVLGTGVGAIGAVILVRSLKTQGLDVIVIPWAQLGFFLALAAGSGVIAAVLPAWRASRLPVLDAISVEFHDSGDRK